MPIHFSKMHGAGNDFVVIDLRGGQAAPDAALARAIGDRHTGVGFDQLMTMEASDDRQLRRALPHLEQRRLPGRSNAAMARAASPRGWCATARRRRRASASTVRSATIEVDCLPDGRFELDMGRPDFAPATIPLQAASAQVDLPHVPGGRDDRIRRRVDGQSACAGRGGRHRPRAGRADRAVAAAHRACSRKASTSASRRCIARDTIRLRVYERGVGETLACGSGACAAVAVLIRQGRVDRDVTVHLPGGELRHHLARRRCAGAHGRAGDIRVRRGVAAMTEEKKERLSAHEVAAWLRRHPRFLDQFPDLALSLVVPREEGPAASLASYQLEVLRDKNRELTRRLQRAVRQRAGERAPDGAHAPADAGADARGQRGRHACARWWPAWPRISRATLVRVVLFQPVPDLTPDWLQVISGARQARCCRSAIAWPAASRSAAACKPDKMPLLYGERATQRAVGRAAPDAGHRPDRGRQPRRQPLLPGHGHAVPAPDGRDLRRGDGSASPSA